MKNKFLPAWLGASVLALSLAVLPSTLPASAQTTTEPVAPSNTVTTTNDDYGNDEFDWGWLGLLGLIGLAGLKGRDHDTRTSYDARTTTPYPNNPRS